MSRYFEEEEYERPYVIEYEEEEDTQEEDIDYEYQQRMRRRARRARERKNKKRFIIATVSLSFIIVVEMILVVVLYFYNWGVGIAKNISDNGERIDYKYVVTHNADLDKETIEVLEGYTNILLLGSDARDNTVDAMNQIGQNHTDAILVASINNKTKDVRLISIYRDTLLQMTDMRKNGTGETTLNKATEAMYTYGIQSTISMINTNLDLDITDYIMVNWEALIELVDAVGGVDVEITSDEMYWINEYLRDTGKNTGRTYENVTTFGNVHLDGIQATAYCRIRYVKTAYESDMEGGINNYDFGRTLRQRTVINLVVEKAKGMGVSALLKAVEILSSYVSSSLSTDDIVSMAKDIMSYKMGESAGFPVDMDMSIKYINGTSVCDPIVALDLKSNVTQLHRFLFGVDDYTPSNTVCEISEKIESLSFTHY